MDKLDNLVLDAFKQKIYTPEHIRGVIDEFRKHAAKLAAPDEKQQLKRLETELQATEQAQTRLFDAVEKGLIEQDDQLKGRFQQNKSKRDSLLAEIANMKRQRQSPLQNLTPQKIEAASRVLNKRLSESTPYAKAYLKASLTEIRIKDELVSLKGQSSTLAELVANNGEIIGQNQVPRFRGEWWAIGGSNSGPDD